MLKTNFKILVLLTAIIMMVSIPLSFAENETTGESLVSTQEEGAVATPVETPTEDPQAPTAETTEGQAEQPAENAETNTSNQEDKLKKNDVYLMGDDIKIDYIVDGNLFVLANNVTIDTQIGGDVFVCAKSVTITENGYIFSNLFAATETLNIKGSIYDLYTTAKDVTISGIVYRDIRVASNNLNIFGTVQRNAYVSSNNINFTNTITNEDNSVSSTTGIIAGNLNYSSSKEFEFPEGTVAGSTNFEQVNETEKNTKGFKDYFVSLITLICTVIIIWLLLTWLAPKFLENSSELLKTKTLPVILTGILAPIVSLLIIVLLLILGVTSKIGLILLIMMIALLLLSSSVTIIALNNIASEKLKDKIKLETKPQKIISLAVISLVYWLISLIPYVGAFISLLVSIAGMGIILYSILFKNKSKKVETK